MRLESRKQCLHELRDTLFGGTFVALRWQNWTDDTHQRGVRPIEAHCVVDHEQLAPILARHDAPMRLVPIGDNLLVCSLLNNESVHHNWLNSARDVNGGAGGLDRLPAGSRNAVQRRVNGVAFALALVVADIDPDR